MKHAYVYTALAEARAAEIGRTDRKEGQPALCGGLPVAGVIAREWLKKGYIREVKDGDIFGRSDGRAD